MSLEDFLTAGQSETPKEMQNNKQMNELINLDFNEEKPVEKPE